MLMTAMPGWRHCRLEKDDNGVGALPPKKRLTINRQDDDKDTVDYSDGVEDRSTDDENAD